MLQALDLSIATGAGLLGTVCLTAWPLFRSRTTMLVAQAMEAALFTIHYVLLGAHAAAFVNGSGALQAAAAATSGSTIHRFRWLEYAATGLVAVAIALTWHGTSSLFAAIAAALISLARVQKDPLSLRALMLAAQPLWMVHDLLVGSWPGLLADVATIATGACMLVREPQVRQAIGHFGLKLVRIKRRSHGTRAFTSFRAERLVEA